MREKGPFSSFSWDCFFDENEQNPEKRGFHLGPDFTLRRFGQDDLSEAFWSR